MASTSDSIPAPRYSSPVPPLTIPRTEQGEVQGLGITQRAGRGSNPFESPDIISAANPNRRYTPSTFRDSPSTPGSSNPLLSPESVRNTSDSYTQDSGGWGKKGTLERMNTLTSERTYETGSEISLGQIGVMSVSLGNDDDQRSRAPVGNNVCMLTLGRTLQFLSTNIHTPRSNWLSISILILSIYSTVFSGIWLIMSWVQPRWGRKIRSGGSLTPATASIVFTLFAKTIELSVVTVFVTFLGQVLSRRSLVKASRGVTIAEMTLRTWVIQPGFMITHFQHMKHTALSFLGVITLIAALVSMFYTTASDALVSPHLRFGRWDHRIMEGLVKTQYASSGYIGNNCQTLITTEMDVNAGSTCLDIENAGQAYHNIGGFFAAWAAVSKEGIGVSSELILRPNGIVTLFDNTTVTGSWITTNSSNMTASSGTFGRMVNNVNLAMPHAGVFTAAKDPKNGIVQPPELEGVGEYSLRASVVSPAVNVLCANVKAEEIAPLVYVTWPNALLSQDGPGQKLALDNFTSDIQLLPGQHYLNSTVIDDIFQWGAKYSRQPPVFKMFPSAYNSIANVTMLSTDGVYMLIKASDAVTPNYTICELRSFLYSSCSTSFTLSGLSGSNLKSRCDDPTDGMRYDKSVQDVPISRDMNWKWVAAEWMLSLALNTGISNANSSTARMLSNLITSDLGAGAPKLNPLLHSIAETLAVMAGNTLLLGTIDSTFYHYWSYQKTMLDLGTYEKFNASIPSQEYTSGIVPGQKWQGIFYIVLFLVFVTNVFCLVYFFARAGLVTVYSEPQNLFALAVNSPPSDRLSGSCGAGPEGHQLDVNWHVKQEPSSGHLFIQEGDRGAAQAAEYELRRGHQLHNLKSQSSYSVLSSKRGSLL